MLKRNHLIILLLSVLTAHFAFADQGGNDGFGYMWTDSRGTVNIDYEWIDAKDGTYYGDDFTSEISLPFTFIFYGQPRNSLFISSKGWFSFDDITGLADPAQPVNEQLPTDSLNTIVAPFWDNLINSSGHDGGFYIKTVGSTPNRKFIIEWNMIERVLQGANTINFQVILFETSNLIKFQYNFIDNNFNGGDSATIGIQGDSTKFINYSYNQVGAVSSGMAILFHNKFLGDTAEVAISPNTAEAGSFSTLEYTYFNIDTSDTVGLGKADRFAIGNPFAPSAMTVTGIQINSVDAFIKNSTDKPTNPGYATWQYNSGQDSLIIQTSHFDVIDSLKITFVQTMPEQLSTGNAYGSSFDAVLDSTSRQVSTPAGNEVDIVGATVVYYEFSPAIDSTFTAGTGIQFTVTARDEYGNGVANSDSVNLSTPGSSTASFNVTSPVPFGGASSVNFTVTDTVVGSFTVRAVNTNNESVNGESGLITVNPAAADHFSVLSSTDSIRVRAERLLQVRLEDQYGNFLADSNITFTRIHGNGYFITAGNGDTVVTTNANGIAEALYTASDSLSFVDDSIRVTFNAIADTIVLPLKAGAVAYYEFAPADSQFTTAGDSVFFTITARDAYGNGVLNSGQVNLSAVGSITAAFRQDMPIGFGGDSTITTAVVDETAGSFTVRAVNNSNSSVKGESGLITVNPDAEDHFVILSSQDAIRVGTDRLLQVRLEDQYNNIISGASVTFNRIQGNGYFITSGNPDTVVTTNANGIAEALYTASNSIAFGSDQIEVSYNLVNTTIEMTLQAGAISYYEFTPADSQFTTAGDSVFFTITARDAYGNGVLNSGQVNLSAVGSTTAAFRQDMPIGFGGDSTITTAVVDETAGSFTVRAVNNSNSSVKGESGLITVGVGPINYVLIRSEARNGGSEVGALTLSTDDRYTFYSAGYDQYGNYIDDVNVNWSTTGDLESVTLSNANKFTFNPTLAGVSGTVRADHATAGFDETGAITITAGALARLRIQSTPLDNGPEVNDVNMTANDDLVLYAVGYDADGNFIGRTAANWTLNNLSGSLEPDNPTDSVTFIPQSTGSGSIRATANADPSVLDNTGTITVTPGAISYVIIRSEPNGTGQEVAAVSLTVGQTLTLYAAGYDSKNNFSANANVDWSTTGTLTGLSTNNTNTYVVTLTPSEPGSGTVETSNSSGWTNDATGTITVSAGNLARIEIRTASGGGGVVLNDSTARAGDSWTLYAAGYDLYGNYLGDELVAWSVSGDSIGSFVNADSASSNTFNFSTVNTSRLRIDKSVGSNTLTDYSGLIKVNAGDPATMAYVSASNFSGQAGSTLSDSLGIRVFDAFGNAAPNVPVTWEVTDPSGELNPDSDLTDLLGVSRSKWKLKSTTGADSAYAIVAAIPDTLIFRANVLESTADRMVRWDDAANPEVRNGIVRTALAQPLAIQVLDSFDNPVPGVSVTFGVVSFPAGGSDYSFGTIAGTTGNDGLFQSTFTPGSKVGDYLITAYNEELINSGSTFFTVSASAGAANRLVFVTESGLQDTVATTYGDSVQVRVEDAYQNVVTTGVTVNWQATGSGSVNPPSSESNSSGIAATEWTLSQQAGTDTLYARSTGLPDVFITASLIPGAPYAVLADSGSQRSGIAGGTQIVRARLEDQFGNTISGRNVFFETVSPAGFVSNAAVRSDVDGLAQTTYTTPTNLDTSYVRAFIANVDTAVFELYGVRYISGSLDPALVAYNDTVSFYIDVTNPGSDVVPLDTSRTTFSFANQLVTTTLDSPLTLSGSTVRMKFKPAVIDTALSGGRYTPVISFAGEDTYAGLNGKLSTDAGELSVEPISIEYVRVPNPKIFPRGTVVTPVLMNVRNSGNTEVTIDTVGLTFSPAGYDFQPVLETPITSLLPGQERTLEFTITVPADAPADTFIVDGFISCTCTVTGAVLGANRAHQNDILIVTDAINLAYVNFSPQRVSEGQTVTMQIQIDNLGDYDILVDRNNTRLEFGSQQFTLSGNQALGAGNVSTITFNSAAITLTALNSPYEGILYLQGTENGNVVRDTLYTASLDDSLEVQTIANLEFAAVELSQSAVRQGQSGETLTVRLNNSGQADAVISNSDQVAINITSVPNAYQLTALQSFPFTVAGGTLDSLLYQIKVAADAPLGVDTFTVDITYNDGNSNQSTLLSDPSYFDFWEVFSPGRITITSVQSDFDSVSTGQENIPVVVRIRNDGQTTVRVDSIQLKISRGFYVPSTLYTLSSKTLNAAQADTFNLSVSIDPASVTGSAVVNASAYGVIVSDSAPVQDLEADTTHSWLIQRAAEILASNNQPTQISEAQDISPTVTVSNNGDARLLIDETNSYIEAVTAPAFRRSLVSPLVIEGKQNNVLLNFESGPENIGAGTYDLVLHLEGAENGAPYVQDINLPNTLLIQTAASLEVEFVSAIPENISRDADTLVTIQVRNNGQADLQIDSLIVIPYGIPVQLTPTLPFTLGDNASNLFDAVINIPADADTGLITLDARGVGRDLNSNAQTIAGNATSTDSWNVFTRPQVVVTAMTAPDSVARLGQNDIPVSITIRNNGGSPVRINSLQLIQQIGLYNHDYPPVPFIVSAYSDTTVIDLVDVLPNSATGRDTLRTRLNYTNLYSGKSSNYQSSEYLTWQLVSGEAAVSIVSVNAVNTKVSHGQSGAEVQVRLRNNGGSSAIVNTLDLIFANGNDNYVLGAASPALPFELVSGLEQFFNIAVSVNEDAQTGSDTVHAAINITQTQSGDNFDIIEPTINDTWLVQLRPFVAIDSVGITPSVASTGQSGLRGSLYLSNAAGADRAEARIDTVQLRFLTGAVDQSDQFNIVRLSTPTLPLVLQAGTTTRFDFDVAVLATTPEDTYQVNGYVVSRDLNDGQDSVQSTTTNPDTLVVQNLAALAINNVTVIPDTVSQQQTHARVYVDYQNNGSAPVEIRQTALSFNPALNFRPVLTTRSTPFTLSGGERDTLIYALTIPDTYNDVVYVGASISGRDLNSATNVSVEADSATSFLIQTPADVFWVAGSTWPTTAEADTSVSFRLRVTNSGEATVKLDSNLTTLHLENTAYSIPLSGSSAQVIQADPDTTELLFRETLLTGIPEGEYNLILNLRGTTNDSVYAKTINAGTFAFGDSLVSITSIQIVESSQVLQGDTALQVIMIVSNSGNPLSIDPGLDETTLLFRDPLSGDSRDAAVLNLQRQDTLTVLRQLPNNRLEFRFDLSESFPLGITNIFGQISLQNNQIVKQSSTFAELNVQTSGNADYVVNTLRPDTVIARQVVSFRADFLNSGSSDVVLNTDSTWIEILGSGLNPILLAGKSTAGGGDTTTLNFNTVTIPADILPGEYDLYWQVRGKLANQAPYANSGIVTNQLRVVPPALIIVNQTDITPERVRQGESNIPVSYTIQNTGQSNAIITGFNHVFRSGVDDVSNDWLLNTNILFPDTLRQGQQRQYDLLFSLSSSAQPGYARSEPQVNFYDWRTPQLITQSSLVLSPDSALVLRPARIRIDSLIIVRDSNAPNAPFVNIDSTFNMKVVVSNTGADSIQSALLNIFRNEQLLSETISLSSIPATPDSQRVAYFSQRAENLGTVQYKVRVKEARDVNGTLIAIDQPLDNVENVIVQQPSQLWISAEITMPEGARDGIVSLNQEFTVQARVNRSGQSPVGPGTLSLRLPPNFQIVTAPNDTLRAFDVDNAVVQWQIRPTGLTGPQPFDSLEFYLREVPIDSNTFRSAIVTSRSEKLAVRVENPGTITTLVAVTAPQGATDGVVSAGQLFTLTSTINFVNSIAESGRTAKIILPDDYSVQDSSLAVLPETNSLEVNWNIIAPRGPGAGFDSLYVQVSAFDANSGQPVTQRSTPTRIRVVTPAQISLAAKIISPAGAADRIVSTRQEVILEASVSNIGQAGIDDSGSIQLRTTNGILFKSNLSAQKTISAFALSAYTDTLLMPAVAGVGEVIAHILPEELPNDENSGNPVLIRRDSINIALQIVDRADLFVRFDKATSINDTLIRSVNQQFSVKALVRNRGTAAVDTSRWLRLDLNQSGLQFNNDQARKTFGLSDTVTWNLIAPSNPAQTEIYVRADSEPLDENDGLNAFRNPADAVDTVRVEFKAVSNIVMNSIFVKNNRDSLTVSTEQDSIIISADIFFDPILDAQREVTLILPAGKGYASLDQNLTRVLTEPINSDVRWLLRAPGKAEDWSPLILRSTAVSQSIPGLPVQIQSDTLYIRTQPRATLSLALQIVEPSGAMDDSISYGQAFKLQALLRNRPDVAGVSGQGLASIQLPEDFSLLDTLDVSAVVQKPILVDQPVFWWIRASETGMKISSKTELLNLLNTKISAESRATIMEGQSAPRLDMDKVFELKKAMSGQAEQITVRLDALPLDINTSKPAFILNNPESRTVYLEEKAAITVQSLEAPDTLSTGQSFDLTITGQLSGNLVNAAAFVQIPATIGISPAPLALDFDNRVSLRLTIPADYQGSGTETINIFLVGTDANTGQQSALSNTVQHILRIEARPELALSKPLVDPVYVLTEGLISRGQEIEIQVQPVYAQQTSGLPFASIKGSGVARLEAPGFSFVGGHTANKPFSQIGQNLTWRIKAPIVDLTANIKIKFEQVPLDKNSNLPATVQPDSGLVLIPVRVRQKTVTVTVENDLISDTTFTVDRQNITMLIFKVSNEEYNDDLYVDRITLAFHSNIGEPSAENLFLSSALVKLFKTITVEEYTSEAISVNLGKDSKAKKLSSFIDYTVTDSSINPLELRFGEPDIISSGETRYYRVKGEFQDNTLSRGFRIVLNDVHAFDFDVDNPLDIIDPLGKPLAQSKAFSSKMLTVISSSLEEDFYNYPNPFGRDYPETFFTFRLEQSADVDIRIFTLLGELVWSWKGTALPPGVYDRFVRWDGRNDRGNVVLNGVYLCYIDMKIQGGQNKRFMTKIAYIK